MARSENALLIALVVALSTSAAALDFNVDVSPTPEAGVYNPNASTQDYFNASVDIQNPGSVGCEFRIRGDIRQDSQDITRYSTAYRMWPGDTNRAEFLYLPINHTGQVDANLTLEYCDRSKHIEDYSFNYSERIVPNSTIESKTLEVNSSAALVDFKIDDAVLIPQQYPGYWKVGSERVRDSRAVLEYEPTLFRGGEQIKYTVVRNGTVEGEATVVLEDQEKWYEEIIRSITSML